MSSSPPSRREAWRRLQEARPPAWVLDHSRRVEALAAAMATRCSDAGHAVSLQDVCAGALLHDIGRSVSQGLDHAAIGADLLRRPPAVAEPVVRIVETHTGAGILSDEASAAGLPPRDYVPRSLEQRIVAHADNLHSGSRRLRLEQVEAKYVARGLGAAARRIRDLHEELGTLLGVDLDALEPEELPPP